MNRTRGAGQVVYLIHFNNNGHGDVVSYEFKIGIADEMSDVVLGARKEIIKADNIVAFLYQSITQM